MKNLSSLCAWEDQNQNLGIRFNKFDKIELLLLKIFQNFIELCGNAQDRKIK